MSNTNTNGGPAFPEIRIHGGDNYNPPTKLYYGGMTLRDYFAAKAMQAYFTDPNVGFGSDVIEAGSLAAYRIADAMLKASGD